MSFIFIRSSGRLHGIAMLILLIGLLLRLAVLPDDGLQAYYPQGGDTAWLLANGEGLLSGQNSGTSRFGIPYYVEVLPTPPLYLVFVGVWQAITSADTAVTGIRLSQVGLSLLTAILASAIAMRVFRSRRGALLVLAALCLDPSQVLEPIQITTETLYIALIVSGLWLYVHLVAADTLPMSEANLIPDPSPEEKGEKPHVVSRIEGVGVRLFSATQQVVADTSPSSTKVSGRGQAFLFSLALLVGVLLGLATLTRAVGLLFPVLLGLHGLWAWRNQPRRAVLLMGGLLLAYSATVGTWTLYNLLTYNRFVVASTQLFPAIWRGAVTNDGSPQQNDALLIDPHELPQDCVQDCKFQVPTTTYVQQTGDVIRADPLGYVSGRLRELANAVLLPHGATNANGESLRDLLGDWARDGFSGAGFVRLLQGDYFSLKLVIYVFQLAAYGLALVGLWRTRRQMRRAGVPLAFIVYTLAIHTVLLALPRYIFPILPCCWMLAAGVFWRSDE